MKLQYHIIGEKDLNPFVQKLRLIEKDIEYPLEDGGENFFIDHGKQYSPFFTQQGFKTRFLIILDNDNVVGSIAGVWKKTISNGKKYNALYASDLKLKREYRNKGLVKNFLWYLIIRWPFIKDFKGWDFIYFCAMQRSNKGVEATFKGFHLGRLTKSEAVLNIYILDPIKFKEVDIEKIYFEPESEINLSPNLIDDVLWNDGKKNIVSTKDKSIMKLGHINPQLFYKENNLRLQDAVTNIARNKGSLCFAIDNKNHVVINQLEKYGIYTDTKCKVFSFSPFSKPFNPDQIISISTGEI